MKIPWPETTRGRCQNAAVPAKASYCICRSVDLPILSVELLACPVDLAAALSVYLPTYLSPGLSIYRPADLSVDLPVYLPSCQNINCLSVYLSI